MKTQDNFKFLTGKESVVTSTLLLVAVIIFIVPIVLVFSLRFIYKWTQKAKESVTISTQTNASFNKVY